MENLGHDETWKFIPPEEKIAIMSQAHGSGAASALGAVIVCCTMAVALQLPLLVWSSLIAAPLVFQLAAGRAWRDLKPRIMLEYLAARSAARRYAFNIQAKDLTLNLVFRGVIRTGGVNANNDLLKEALEAMASKVRETEVWVALFRDSIVMISEAAGGARLEFGVLINDKMGISSNDGGAYKTGKELTIRFKDKAGTERSIRLASKFPAALVVFEKKVGQQQIDINLAKSVIENPVAVASEFGDDSGSSQSGDSLFS